MLTQEQKDQLAADLSAAKVKTRQQAGRSVAYVEGWAVIAEANRIFGFDGWARETIEMRCVSERVREIGKERKQGWSVSYTGKVRVTVTCGGDLIVREGFGAGHGIDADLGQAHESAVKECETDAMKRALMTFGNPFGLALYDKEQTHVSDDRPAAPASRAPAPAAPSRAAPAGKGQFIERTKQYIEECEEETTLREWWISEAQREGRRQFGLDAHEVDDLKQLVIARIQAINMSDLRMAG